MSEPTVALIAVASPVESGGERGQALLDEAGRALTAAGLRVARHAKVVSGLEDASAAVSALRPASPDLVVILHCSWVVDALQYQLIQGLAAHPLLWAVPYPETFSLASVQHASSVLRGARLGSSWGYGAVDDHAFSAKVAGLARAARAARRLRDAKALLVTHRSTWRSAGPQDTTYDEWDLATSLGVTVLHMDIDEFVGRAMGYPDDAARAVLDERIGRFGHVNVDAARLLGSAKVYLAVQDLRRELDLMAIAIACYPTHFGLANLAASWLGDEGMYLDPEGDVGHAVLANLLLGMDPAPVALAEPVLLDREADILYLRHEGSSPASLAADRDEAYVQPLADGTGTQIEFSMRPLPKVTGASLRGRDGRYELWHGAFETLRIEPEDWDRLGRAFLVGLQSRSGAADLLDRMFATGMDHHLVLQAGDQRQSLADLARLSGAAAIELN